MVDMSEIYKNKKKALVRGSGDLATGVGVALYRAGFQVIMTDIAVPLTVRREVAMSRAVYEGRAKVEGIEGILVRSYQEALAVLEENKIAVIVDPKAEICKEFHPDLLVDAILAKKNMGTRRTDAPYVIGLGPGFTAGKDVHAVIETMRGETLADIFYDGQPIPNTGVPGYVGGYALERLIRASGNGRMEPKAQIGDIVKKGQLLAVTGGKPVYSQLDGVIRGMLQEGVQVNAVIMRSAKERENVVCITIWTSSRSGKASTSSIVSTMYGASPAHSATLSISGCFFSPTSTIFLPSAASPFAISWFLFTKGQVASSKTDFLRLRLL